MPRRRQEGVPAEDNPAIRNQAPAPEPAANPPPNLVDFLEDPLRALPEEPPQAPPPIQQVQQLQLPENQPGNPRGFRVKSRYDSSWTNSYQVITAKSKRLQLESTRDEDLVVRPYEPDAAIVSEVIIGILLNIRRPSESKPDVQFRRVSFGKKTQTQTTFKAIYSLGDLNDASGGSTISLIEKNNSDHTEFHRRDMQKREITIGCRIAILCPQIIGVLKNGSTLVHTSRPLQVLAAPPIPEVPYLPHAVQLEKKYFVIKMATIHPKRNSFPIPICTNCSANTCDRLLCSENPNAPCGCFSQFSRTTNNAKNVCFKTTFYIDAQGDLLSVKDFTSLRFSKLLFENEIIVHDIEQMHDSAVISLIAEKWRPFLQHVNNNGGWTVVGWMVRAKKQVEEGINVTNDQDADLLHDTIKTNICYVYPTTLRHNDIPTYLLVQHARINEILNRAPEPINQRDMQNDNL